MDNDNHPLEPVLVNKKKLDPGRFVRSFFLIFVGIIFLLNTTGVVDWTVWTYIWRFWPVLIILSGLSLVVGSGRGVSLIISLFSLVTFVGVGIFSLGAVNSPIVADILFFTMVDFKHERH
ncbi:hypothetical protein CO179_02020 [candidate division WWE3 bacterium CG_4_9_14_3_um_filter_39_7]|uniref:LiaI-LiaF-like transmembrane region domain-containing protein n=1 Tax=candidate division WWE3 bacterium CG_4_9_14_3_um_filter_39_7 TaxID=1975080 RepID=A0A2M7X2Y5_UNCKA|nr:MAG: hypothetical protein CO179_02020 [candidate division WWE3 bacterium CG_4_9_14_3_um_filter_39_7]